MNFQPTNLANGQLSNTPVTLYTVPAGVTAILRSTLLVNSSASDVTLNLWADLGTGSRHFVPVNLLLRAGQKYDDNSIIHLPAGATIIGAANTSSVVDFIFSGVISV